MTGWIAALLATLGMMSMQDNDASIVARDDRVWIAEQPSEADLDAWAAAGARAVVNSRTPQETASLPFDLRAAVEARGMTYVEMPIGGAYGADAAHTQALAALLDETDGPVVMHCRSGTRSAHLYSAYLVSRDPQLEDPFGSFDWNGGRDGRMVEALTPR